MDRFYPLRGRKRSRKGVALAGAGFETPDWLADLEDEAEQVQAPLIEDDYPDPYLDLPEVHLTLDETRRQVKRMARET